MSKASLIGLGATTVVVALMAGWWFSQPTTGLVLKSENCDLNQQVCTITTPTNQTIQLSFSPEPVPILAPITIEANLTGFSTPPEKLQVVLEGINMYMGFQKAWLEPKHNTGQYTGTLQIPMCQETHMQWKVTLFLPKQPTVERAEFYMATQRQ